MKAAIESSRKDGVGCVGNLTELFYGGARGSRLIGGGDGVGELPALEGRLAIGGGDGGEIKEGRGRNGDGEQLNEKHEGQAHGLIIGRFEKSDFFCIE